MTAIFVVQQQNINSLIFDNVTSVTDFFLPRKHCVGMTIGQVEWLGLVEVQGANRVVEWLEALK